jgi:hypothetical protein
MVQGNLLALTLEHLALASKTGLLAVFPTMAVTFTPYARHFVNRWTSSAFLGVCTLLADAVVHLSIQLIGTATRAVYRPYSVR